MTPASARHPSQFPTIFTLSHPDGVLQLAEQCRGALLAFLNGVGLEGWGCEELGTWLSGPYETVTRMATEVAPPRRAGRRPLPRLRRCWIEPRSSNSWCKPTESA
jgi:hypothetical protein